MKGAGGPSFLLLMEPARNSPVTIAHRAANDLGRLQAAVAAGVDFAEADIRWDGEPVARHERRVPLLPVYWDRWRLRWDTCRAPALASLLDLLYSHPTRLFLDIKAQDRRASAAILEVLRRRDALSTVEISSQYWPALEQLREKAPELRLFRSVGHPPQLEALHRLLGSDPLQPAGIAIDRRLLAPDLAAALRERGLDVYAWGVKDQEEAERLLEWGATGIIADDLGLLKSLKGS